MKSWFSVEVNKSKIGSIKKLSFAHPKGVLSLISIYSDEVNVSKPKFEYTVLRL